MVGVGVGGQGVVAEAGGVEVGVGVEEGGDGFGDGFAVLAGQGEGADGLGEVDPGPAGVFG